MVLTVPEIRASEEFTMRDEAISALDLMERAGTVFADAVWRRCTPAQSVYIFCGPGNNGGDGLVVARQLATKTRVVRWIAPLISGNLLSFNKILND